VIRWNSWPYQNLSEYVPLIYVIYTLRCLQNNNRSSSYGIKGEFEISLESFEITLQLFILNHVHVLRPRNNKGVFLEYLEIKDKILTMFEEGLNIQKQTFFLRISRTSTLFKQHW